MLKLESQLISIAKLENDNKEIKNQLKNIERINLQSMKNIERLQKIMEEKKER